MITFRKEMNIMNTIAINPISMIEKNIRGAWVVYGLLGIRQYYGYTKTQSIEMYKKECSEKIFINKKKSALYR